MKVTSCSSRGEGSVAFWVLKERRLLRGGSYLGWGKFESLWDGGRGWMREMLREKAGFAT